MKKAFWVFLVAALVVGGLLSPWASPNPDGLERVAEDKGFLHQGEGQEVVHSPLPDYSVPGVANPRVSTALAGAVGTLAMLAAGYGLGRALRGRAAGDGDSSHRLES